MKSPNSALWIFTVSVLLLGSRIVSAAEPQIQAEQILKAASVKGGLVVHIGCGDGKLTAALRANDSYLVHGLDADAKNVEKAREHIRSLNLYGKVTVEHFTEPDVVGAGKRLPYTDNLVNLIVVDRPKAGMIRPAVGGLGRSLWMR